MMPLDSLEDQIDAVLKRAETDKLLNSIPENIRMRCTPGHTGQYLTVSLDVSVSHIAHTRMFQDQLVADIVKQLSRHIAGVIGRLDFQIDTMILDSVKDEIKTQVKKAVADKTDEILEDILA